MMKTTTKASLLDRELAPHEQLMSNYYEQVCSLPAKMESTLPFGHESNIITRLYDDVLGRLFGRVSVDHTNVEGKDYYRLTLRVLNRKHSFILNPLAAYMQANVIMTLQRMQIMEHMLYEGVNTIYVPTWARRGVYEACRQIYKDHRAEVDGHVAMLESFKQPEGEDNVSPALH